MATPRAPTPAFGLALSACGGDAPAQDTAVIDPAVARAPGDATPAETAAEVAPYDGPAFETTITPVGELVEYVEAGSTVRPGQTVRLTFTHTATQEVMHHNVVVTAMNADVNDVGQAAMSAADSDSVPAGSDDQILAHTAMSAPGETVTAGSTAPAEGDRTYVCTVHVVAGGPAAPADLTNQAGGDAP